MSIPARKTGTQACELKGSRFTLSVLNLLDTDLAAIDAKLAALVAQAPGFLERAPVVLDAARIAEQGAALDLDSLVAVLRKHTLVPVALRGGDAALQERAMAAGLALMPETAAPVADSRTTEQVRPAAAPGGGPRIVNRPVRSGQQVYAEGGDLIVLGAVSAGAEIIADGSIHVYGALRGRAIAGARGDEAAHIFCQSLEAELISIAGCYRVFETEPDETRGRPVHASLSGERLLIEML